MNGARHDSETAPADHAAESDRVGSARDRLRAGMTATLQAFLSSASGSETALEKAYEIGRDALRDGLGLMDLNEAHSAVLLEQLKSAGSDASAMVAIVERSEVLFRETAAPFEMAQRGYRE